MEGIRGEEPFDECEQPSPRLKSSTQLDRGHALFTIKSTLQTAPSSPLQKPLQVSAPIAHQTERCRVGPMRGHGFNQRGLQMRLATMKGVIGADQTLKRLPSDLHGFWLRFENVHGVYCKRRGFTCME